jgi:hypothetical protein
MDFHSPAVKPQIPSAPSAQINDGIVEDVWDINPKADTLAQNAVENFGGGFDRDGWY